VGDNVYSVSEIVGTSPDSIEDAIKTALARANRTLRNLDWFEVVSVRGHLADDGTVHHFQVTLKLGFRMEE
jgi:flavin-binding protein dodecin